MTDDELLELRRRIDELDRALLELVAERVRAVLAVGEVKRARGLAVYDPERERAILERLAARAPTPLAPHTVRRIFERLIDECRRVEHRAVEGEPPED
ncbi:MAG: chorismate mutase [Polyangiaceae bacterium]|nr:chorismate mutase [Polyangiaceae bacterium]